MNLKVIDDERPWFADSGLNFTCTQCGNCCTGGPGYVWMSPEEIQRLADHLGISVEQTLKRYCRKLGDRISLKEKINRGQHDCIFLKEFEVMVEVEGADKPVRQTKRGCSIYQVRPLQCRTWPFWPEVIRTPQSWARAGKGCPGINNGDRHFNLREIERIRDAADWPKNPPSSAKK